MGIQPTRRSGPRAGGTWSRAESVHSDGRAVMALSAPDALSSTVHVVATPGLGSPGPNALNFTLTLILSRPPSLDDIGIEPLVTGGVLAMSLQVTPTQEELRRAAEISGAGTAVALFVHEARWKIVDTVTGECCAEAAVMGNGGAVALSRAVDRDRALSALAALRGGDCHLEASCEIVYRAAPSAPLTQTSVESSYGTVTTVTHTSTVGAKYTMVLQRPCAELAGEALQGAPFEAIVRAVCPESNGTLVPIAHREVPTRAGLKPREPTGFGAVGNDVAAMPAVLKTSRASRFNAHVLAASDLAIRPFTGFAHHWQIDDLVLSPASANQQSLHLPLIVGDAPLWPDRVDGTRFWYPPEFSLAIPEPLATPADAPFLFAFTVVGHDQQGRPGLEATLRMTLRMAMSTATRKEWEVRGRPRCEPVPTGGLSVLLAIPFRDDQGMGRTQTVAATDVRAVDGSVLCTFALTDQWARLAYGALGTRGFQASLARLDIAYYFSVYVPVDAAKTPICWGGKRAAIELGTLRGLPMAPHAERRPQLAAGHVASLPASPAVAMHPVLRPPQVLVRPETYGVRTQGRTSSLEVFLSCSQFGQLYIQKGDPQTAQSDISIGCQDSFALGQISLRLYEALPLNIGIGGPAFTVYRSLQVPGRFLVLPAAYTVTRFEPADPRAYRPAIYLFSNVDANHPERTNCILTATLRPAVTAASLRALLDTLRATVHPNPTLEWPTELQAQPVYSWAIPGGQPQIAAAAVKTPEGFQVSFSAGIDQILLLKSMVETSGVIAGVAFTLADGTTLQSTLVVDLGRVDGPWDAGAVSVAVSAGVATLTNRIERAADIEDLFAYSNGVRVGIVPVDQRVAPQASFTVPLATGIDDATVTYTLADTPIGLEEIRTFIEDIFTNVVFVCVFDLAAAGLEKLIVEARIAGVAGDDTIVITPSVMSGDMSFVLPLTAYLTQSTLQYRTTVTAANGIARTGPWRDWRLDVRGNIVELEKDELLEA